MRSQRFRDFDAFADSVRDVDSVMMLQNPKVRSWRLDRLDLAGIHLQRGREGGGNITEGLTHANGFVLFLPVSNAPAHAANGVPLDEDSFAVLEPGSEFCIRCETEHNWCSVYLSTEALADVGDLLAPPSPAERASCRVVRSERQIVSRLREQIQRILITAAGCPEFESAPAASSAAKDLREAVSLALGRQPPLKPTPEGRPVVPRGQIIGRCQTLLEERKHEAVRVGDLAVAANVSERTLRRVFNEYFGVGPVRYLQLRQLRQVRRALKVSDPEATSVGSILVEHGVWEFSRLAARYKRLFGELPVETLNSRRKGSTPRESGDNE